MEEKDFLSKVFEILAISPEGQTEIRKQFGEILSAKFLEAFLVELPEDKRESFTQLLEENEPAKEKMDEWLKAQNISLSPESVQKIDQIVKDSLGELMGIIVKDINEEERAQLLSLTKEETK
jgi:succinate dehydrogenase flavin-adding protein (antitoxin of CptAB toxin-antitoxin module)